MSDIALVLVVILVFLILFRGPRVLPGIGRAFGDAVRRLRRAGKHLE